MTTRPRTAIPTQDLLGILGSVKQHDFNGTTVRSVEKDGQTWVVFSDVCKALGYKNPNSEKRRLDKAQKRYIDVGMKSSLAVCATIDGLVLFANFSKKPRAEELLHWISSEFPKEGYCQ